MQFISELSGGNDMMMLKGGIGRAANMKRDTFKGVTLKEVSCREHLTGKLVSVSQREGGDLQRGVAKGRGWRRQGQDGMHRSPPGVEGNVFCRKGGVRQKARAHTCARASHTPPPLQRLPPPPPKTMS